MLQGDRPLTQRSSPRPIFGGFLLIGILWVLFTALLTLFFFNSPSPLFAATAIGAAILTGLTAATFYRFSARHGRELQQLQTGFAAALEQEKGGNGRKEAVTAALRESEKRYRTLFENAGDAIFILEAEGDSAGTIVDANEAAAVMHGYTVAELLKMKIADLDAPDAAREAPDRLRKVVAGEWIHAEIMHRKKDGSAFPVEISAGLLQIEDHKYVLAIDRDVSDRKAAEDFRKNILEAVDEAFIIIDRDFRVLSVNSAYCRQVQLSAGGIVGRHCYEISHKRSTPCWLAGEECTVRNTFQSNRPHTALHTHVDSKGNLVYVETKSFPIENDSGQVVSAIEIINDITVKRKLEEQLRHAQKMEAIGTLTGGIAHDFNNILTTILGYASLFQKKVPDEDPLRPAVDHIFTAARRAATLTRSLLAFSRKQAITSLPEDLNDIVRNLENLLRRIIGEDVELITDAAAGGITVMADRSQMEQVIMNLCTNARDAMPDGGVLTLSTNRMDVDRERALTLGIEKPGIYAVLTVADTGSGIDEKTREKIFDPFFTTKEVGKGTGLGLSIVYGIVRQHGGAVDVISEPGRGTAFRVYLPLVTARAGRDLAADDARLPGGSETVLVAEDNEEVRTMMRQTLTEYGYTVIEAADGEEAVSKFAERPDGIKLLILDVIMPKKNGKEAFEAIRRLWPGIKVLFTSGYTADVLSKKGIAAEGLDFLAKPLQPDDLVRKVRETLR